MSALGRTLLLTLAAAAVFGASGDAAPRQAPPAAPPAAATPAPAPTPTPTPAPDVPDFVPSEHVKADDAVSFPTDI